MGISFLARTNEKKERKERRNKGTKRKEKEDFSTAMISMHPIRAVEFLPML
jgi:hypothetical protein